MKSSCVLAEQLFSEPNVRPAARDMVSLIASGATEEDIINAGVAHGHTKDYLDRCLTNELDTLLPHLARQNDALAESVSAHPTAGAVLFAARDAELHADDFALTHPEIPSVLLPASKRLWLSSSMSGDLARNFLGQHQLDSKGIKNPNLHYTLVDTGFSGTVGYYLNRTVREAHDIDLLEEERLNVKLVSAQEGGYGSSIIEYQEGDVPRSAQELPHTANILGPRIDIHALENPPQKLMAIAFQLMPRYHGAFADLVEIDGKAVALPKDFHQPPEDNANASVVSPIAAAVVQYRVVSRALER